MLGPSLLHHHRGQFVYSTYVHVLFRMGLHKVRARVFFFGIPSHTNRHTDMLAQRFTKYLHYGSFHRLHFVLSRGFYFFVFLLWMSFEF